MDLVTEEHRQRFDEDGYCIFERAVGDDLLALLRAECQAFIAREDQRMDALGVDVLGISHRGKRYFAKDCHMASPRLGAYLFNERVGRICRGLLGDSVYLFYNQYVVKGAEVGMTFSWHQDSGYVNANRGDPQHRPYLTLWCPLEDVDEANGTIYVLPASRLGVRTAVRHLHDAASNDWVGYFGSDPGDPVIAAAGSIVAFSSVTFHRSGPNTTNRMRRVFLAQYSAEPILTVEGDRSWGRALPFYLDGRRAVGTPPPLPSRLDA